MKVTDEMVEAGLVAFLKAMGVKHPAHEYRGKILDGWSFQVRATLEAALSVTNPAARPDA